MCSMDFILRPITQIFFNIKYQPRSLSHLAAGFPLAHREFSQAAVPLAAKLAYVLLCVNAFPDFFAQPTQFR